MKHTEELVKNWLEESMLSPKRYTKEELRSGLKTPDFKVYKRNNLIFYCEVKAVTEKRESKQDTTPNQLTADIHNAYKKFMACNPNRKYPNVLAFVNQKNTAGIDYLEDVLTGHWFMDNGKAYPFYTKQSEGRIKNEKTEIDLFLWFEFGGEVEKRYTKCNQMHFNSLQSILSSSSS